MFIVPPGGEGHYFFVTDLSIYPSEYAYFDLHVNGEAICTYLEDTETTGDSDTGECTAIVFLQEGNLTVFTDNLCRGHLRHVPPTGPNSFIFAHVSAKKCPCQKLTPPNRSLLPKWEILDPQMFMINEKKIR